jgi:predicted kinase
MLINEITQPVAEGVNDPNIFKAVFMAGAPGSGKSTIAKKLFAGTGMKILNVDDFYNYLRQTKKSTGEPDKDYEVAWEKYRKREKNYLDGRLGIIIDGTGKNPNIMRDVKSYLENLGYETSMIFVNTSLKTSLERAKERAKKPGKDYGREIDPNFVKITWERVQQGLGQLQNIFKDKFFIIDNNTTDTDISYVKKYMNNWLSSPPKSQTAKQWIEQHKKNFFNLPHWNGKTIKIKK